ncbi:MAG: spore protease YyaC [archaeon]
MKKKKELKIHYEDLNCNQEAENKLCELLLKFSAKEKELIIVCIGTDRSTGDSLGPLVGDWLKDEIGDYVKIYGTLDEPVHATNLEEIKKEIKEQYNNPLIIAIDAALSENNDNIGCICIDPSPIEPGSGVNKKLSPIGDISITGIVNIGGYMEYLVLQSTRLSLVVNLARIITSVLKSSIEVLLNANEETEKENNGFNFLKFIRKKFIINITKNKIHTEKVIK